MRDDRGGGRASARETAMRVAARAIVRKCLAAAAGTSIRGHLAQIDDLTFDVVDATAVDDNPFSAQTMQHPAKEAPIDALRCEGVSVGPK